MNNNVKFLKGLASAYASLAEKDANTFYYTTDDGNLYLGSIKLSSATDLDEAIARVGANEEHIGDIKTLTTTNKNNLVAAINELDADLDTEKTASKVTVEEGTDANYAKVYTVKQGETSVGTINIPKDMVVTAATIETNPEGQEAGTYIVLTIANATNDKLYINVGTLVDIYTAAADATQVQVAIDQSTNTISASIVAGSIGSTELAENAVTTTKIANSNVTKEKLAEDIQTSLGKADTAVQSVTEGTANGTIAVNGTNVAIKGLASAAYVETSAFDAANSAATAELNAKNYADEKLEEAKAYADNKQVVWGTIA